MPFLSSSPFEICSPWQNIPPLTPFTDSWVLVRGRHTGCGPILHRRRLLFAFRATFRSTAHTLVSTVRSGQFLFATTQDDAQIPGRQARHSRLPLASRVRLGSAGCSSLWRPSGWWISRATARPFAFPFAQSRPADRSWPYRTPGTHTDGVMSPHRSHSRPRSYASGRPTRMRYHRPILVQNLYQGARMPATASHASTTAPCAPHPVQTMYPSRDSHRTHPVETFAPTLCRYHDMAQYGTLKDTQSATTAGPCHDVCSTSAVASALSPSHVVSHSSPLPGPEGIRLTRSDPIQSWYTETAISGVPRYGNIALLH